MSVDKLDGWIFLVAMALCIYVLHSVNAYLNSPQRLRDQAERRAQDEARAAALRPLAVRDRRRR